MTVKSGLACRGSSGLDAELGGVEALQRWDDPERGIVSPGEFLPMTSAPEPCWR